MGAKLIKYYEVAESKGGLKAKMRLAMKTSISSNAAASAPDSPENLGKFHSAIEEILGTSVPKL